MKKENVIALVEQVAYIENVNFEEDVVVDGNTIRIAGVGGGEYIVYDEDEIREQMAYHIQETASYFNADFLADMTDLPEEVFEALVDKNEAVYKLICKTCGLDEFIDECLNTDGAGHFLNSYDGNEYDLGDGLYAFNC